MAHHEVLFRAVNVHRVDDRVHFLRRFILLTEWFPRECTQQRRLAGASRTTHIAEEDIASHLALPPVSLPGPSDVQRTRPWFIGVAQVREVGKSSPMI